MLNNILYAHFFRNVTRKPKIKQFKIFQKYFVLPGYVFGWYYLLCTKVIADIPHFLRRRHAGVNTANKGYRDTGNEK